MGSTQDGTRTYVAFLRGINVGAHNRMKMDDLRALFESLGYEHVRTYIQSGNVVFETAETDEATFDEAIHDAIEDEFGYDVSVMIRSRDELKKVVENQPFEEPSDDDVALYVTFLQEAPRDEQTRDLMAAETGAEQFVVSGREVYSRVDKSELESGRFTDTGEVLGTAATRRNWNVVTSVSDLASS